MDKRIKNKSNYEVGARYGMLTILGKARTIPIEGKTGRTHYVVMLLCECDCGNQIERNKKHVCEGHGKHCGDIKCKREMRAIRRAMKEPVKEITLKEYLKAKRDSLVPSKIKNTRRSF